MFLMWATKGHRRDSSRNKWSKFLSNLCISLVARHNVNEYNARLRMRRCEKDEGKTVALYMKLDEMRKLSGLP